MPTPVRAILFDFDGVLVNSELLHLRAFQRAVQDAGLPALTEDEYFDELIGFDDRGVWRSIAARRGVQLNAPTLLGLLVHKSQVMRELITERTYRPLPGVEALVRGLWRHYPLAICSGALRDEIDLMLEGVGLRDCFRVITAAEDVTNGKPDPEGYLKTLDELSRLDESVPPFRPEQTLIFEDAPRVIARVREVGFQTVGVPTHYGHDELKADFAIKSLQPPDVRTGIAGLKIYDGE